MGGGVDDGKDDIMGMESKGRDLVWKDDMKGTGRMVD